MSNIENKILKYNNKCINNCPFVFIARPNDPGNGNIRVVMLEITEEQERLLDSNKSLLLNRGGLSFSINPSFCFAYGEFDFSPNSKDINNFDNQNWFNRLYIKHFIPSEYDYDTHTVSSDLRHGRYFDTANLKTYLPYLYACINKPKRVVIFKEYMDIFALRRAEQRAKKQKEYNQNHKDSIDKKRKERIANKKKSKINMLTFNFKK